MVAQHDLFREQYYFLTLQRQREDLCLLGTVKAFIVMLDFFPFYLRFKQPRTSACLYD